ncbi:MAG: hypothetical protein F6K23_37670 [Okeania sp. SIO2C9]|uniref:hypothetical protein n=1 Tax=Okeania sp. SIO2C9 TaxID=2607791 RepID=UPI0013BF138B|nr:hypothetical protein [Okeania sp. SIO2C9]NEQ78221.1 hypothetical protein [Okeania sp. SIO2C9]
MNSKCQCPICLSSLENFVENRIKQGYTNEKILQELNVNLDVEIDMNELNNHLNIFGLLENINSDETTENKPIQVELRNIDFSKYEIDVEKPYEVIDFVQKAHLRVYLNQLEITLDAQNKALSGENIGLPPGCMRDLQVAFSILDKSTALSLIINQAQAIKTVESMGLDINNKDYLDLGNV